MESIWRMKELLIGTYKRYETPVNVFLKFVAGFFIFFKLGVLAGDALSTGKMLLIALIFSALTTVSSCSVFFIFLIIALGIYLFFVSIETALLVVLVLFLFLVFYVRLFPKQSLLIPALFIAYYFKIPYVIPIFAGVYVGIIGIIPIAIGLFLHSMIPAVTYFITLAPKAKFSPLGMPDTFVEIYVALCEYLMKNTQWITNVIIFSLVVIITCIIAHMTFNFAKEFSILIGGIAAIICYIIAILLGKSSYHLFGMIFGVLISTLLVWVFRLFQDIPNYSRAEKIQFEDEDNYYFVKVIPKYKFCDDYEKQKEFELPERFENIDTRRQRRMHNQKE